MTREFRSNVSTFIVMLSWTTKLNKLMKKGVRINISRMLNCKLAPKKPRPLISSMIGYLGAILFRHIRQRPLRYKKLSRGIRSFALRVFLQCGHFDRPSMRPFLSVDIRLSTTETKLPMHVPKIKRIMLLIVDFFKNKSVEVFVFLFCG